MGSGDVVRLDQLVPGGDLLDLQLLGSNCGRVFLGSGDVGGVSLGGIFSACNCLAEMVA